MDLQCWTYIAIFALETAISIKFGRKHFSLNLTYITLWIIIMVADFGFLF